MTFTVHIKNLGLLEELIHGRVIPHIYAFQTNTVPNYLKVGDTYRPLEIRLNEWRQKFPDLVKIKDWLALADKDTYFRDYSVHQFLESDLLKQRLKEDEVPSGKYYSKEFFKDTSKDDVDKAIEFIKKVYNSRSIYPTRFDYYDLNSFEVKEQNYERSNTEWKLRENQKETVEAFLKAVQKGRSNLLMYAVMRFGKSFTSLCCAKEINSKVVLVVSAKADVKNEWKKNVQVPKNFKDFVFLDADSLLKSEKAIQTCLDSGKTVVLFLTLQDLQGEQLKEKHKELFKKTVDLMIIDETHFGARSHSYGAVIQKSKSKIDCNYSDNEDFIEIEEGEKQLQEIEKVLDVKIKLHLSGTPYRILMGSEFSKEDIIAFVQYTDIVEDQQRWDKEHLDNDEYEEWDNPYYGFPQMLRFAFVPNKSFLDKFKSLEGMNTECSFQKMFEVNSKENKFIHEKEVLDLFQAIDGSHDDSNILPFLDYPKLKEGKMCRHMVCVLPRKASCDALEHLITSNKTLFKNLSEYKIINISSAKSNKTIENSQVISKINEYEKSNQKTIVLTVYKMLTGTTVEQWDTMLFLKDTASPQEYDQAIFRLQSPYIKEVKVGEKVIKYNMKPQTLLVDFDIHRMFKMQEQKSLIYNVNTENKGNHILAERIDKEIKISPIITIDTDCLKEVNATDVIEKVLEYSRNKGVLEESTDIPVDTGLFSDSAVRSFIDKEHEIGSKEGLSFDATDSENDIDKDQKENKKNGSEENSNTSSSTDSQLNQSDIETFKRKFRTFYSRILFFAYLTNSEIKSLDDVIKCSCEIDNSRILKNIGIETSFLRLLSNSIDGFILSSIDYAIERINKLSKDNSLKPIERAKVAINKFGRISESEVTTPKNITDEMISSLPSDCFKNLDSEHKILDIASKIGEFSISLVERCEKEEIDISVYKSSILSIPTSSIAYEFTRKVYEILSLDINCIAEKFNSYDLLRVQDDKKNTDYDALSKFLCQNKPFKNIDFNKEQLQVGNMKFNAIVGNPPYQISDGGGDGSSALPIYQEFVEQSKKMSSGYISMIIPARWYSGGKGLDKFRDSMLSDERIEKIHDFPETSDCFPNINIRGGICYFLWNTSHKGNCKVVNHKDGLTNELTRPLREQGTEFFIRYNKAVTIFNKVRSLKENTMVQKVSSRLPFGIPSNFSDYSTTEDSVHNVILYRSDRSQTSSKRVFIEDKYITKNYNLKNNIKVLVSKASPGGDEYPHKIISNPIIAEENSVCTETYLIVDIVRTESEAKNLISYMNTRFFRFMMSLIKNTQNISKSVFSFVPIQNLTESWSDEKLYKKYSLTKDEIDFIESMIKPMN